MIPAILALQKLATTPDSPSWVNVLWAIWGGLSLAALYAGLAVVVRRSFGDLALAGLTLTICLLWLASMTTAFAELIAMGSRSLALVMVLGVSTSLTIVPSYTISRLARRPAPPHPMVQIAWGVASTVAAAVVMVLAVAVIMLVQFNR